jgi:hypothetical protein
MLAMDANIQPTASARRSWMDILSYWACGIFAAAVVYVLSFGPISRLTSTVIYGSGGGFRVARQAPFPGWCRWTTVVYRPLLAVQGGQAGPLPRKVLSWYVNLWMFGHQP